MIRQPIISKKKKKSFTARLYKINKGKKKLNSYMATVKRKFIESNNLKVGDGLLLYLKGNVFPTLLKKHGSKNYIDGKVINSKGKILYSLSTKGKNKWKFYQNLEKKLGDKYGS